MHQPALCSRGDGEPSTRLGEAGEVRTMGNGIKLGPRATILLVVLLAASAVGILTPTLSNTVSKDVQVTGFAVTVTVDGVPETVAPGDVFRVTATLANNANRPIPAVLRMEVRNPNNTVPNELTVYAGCGAEEVVSGTRLIYYIGWHGPVLAPKGTSFAAGSNLASLDAAIGSAEYWPAVLHEIQDRDPAGYASLVVPGLNASAGVRASGSARSAAGPRTASWWRSTRNPAGASSSSSGPSDRTHSGSPATPPTPAGRSKRPDFYFSYRIEIGPRFIGWRTIGLPRWTSLPSSIFCITRGFTAPDSTSRTRTSASSASMASGEACPKTST